MRIFKRNMASSDAFFAQSNPAVWTEWKIEHAVRDGYRINPWVYRAVQLIAQSAASVPWVVVDRERKPIWDHPVTKLLNNPNPFMTRQQALEMVIAWLELAGNSYVKKVNVGPATKEWWPVSPDRIAPRPSRDPARMIDGYRVIREGGTEYDDPEYNEDTVIHLKYSNPADPYLGIAPLMAAGKSVDLDNSQLDWNTSAMQNRGVVDGVFTFKVPLEQTQVTSITDRIMERISGKAKARKPLVIGHDAQYQRMSLSPTEMDFLASRKLNREEILATFGVPPQLVGVQEASTYNNYAVSLRIFWESKILPLLDMLSTAFNQSLKDMLQDGYELTYDKSSVEALKENEAEKAATAKLYYDMGVPLSVLNDKFDLGLTEWEGWDEPPKPAPPPTPPEATPGKRSFKLVPLEQRSADKEAQLRDELADGVVLDAFVAYLENLRTKVFAALDAGTSVNTAVSACSEQLEETLQEVYEKVGLTMAKTVARPKRGLFSGLLEARKDETGITGSYDIYMLNAIKQVLKQEGVILKERSFIDDATVELVTEQVKYAALHGLSMDDLKQALTDTGVFSPARAARISRTVSGAATGVGQMTAGAQAGATHKKWNTSGGPVRDSHAKRSGEVVAIDQRFSVQSGSVGPRYPCDPEVSAADRINCRCFMTFEFREAAAPVKPAKTAKIAKPVKKAPAPAPAPAVPPHPMMAEKIKGAVSLAEAESRGKAIADELVRIHNQTYGLTKANAVNSLAEMRQEDFKKALRTAVRTSGARASDAEIKAYVESILTQVSAPNNRRATFSDRVGTWADDLAKMMPREMVVSMTRSSSKLGSMVISGEYGRAYYVPLDRRIVMYNNDMLAPNTFYHEYMHHVQSSYPMLNRTFQDAFTNRTQGEALRPLNEVARGSYDPSEVGKKDSLPDAYYGRVYANGQALEMISMTGESLLGINSGRYTQLVRQDLRLAHTFLGAVYGYSF